VNCLEEVETASLEDVKTMLYPFNISIAMLKVETVELGLLRQIGGFFATSPAREVTNVELEKFFTVGTAATTPGCATSIQRCQGNARTLSIDRNNGIKPTLPFRFGSTVVGVKLSLRNLNQASGQWGDQCCPERQEMIYSEQPAVPTVVDSMSSIFR
jgi:hypothetical protein